MVATHLLVGFAQLAVAQDVFLARSDPPGTTADVLIIGAGWAGMTAAHTLHQANVSFLVLEASNRTGGRSHALTFGHESVGRFVVERGSNWVSGTGGGSAGSRRRGGGPSEPTVNPVKVLADRVGLKTTPVPSARVPTWMSNSSGDVSAVFDAQGRPTDLDGDVRRRANEAYECINKTAQESDTDTDLRSAVAACGWNPQSDLEWAVDWGLTADSAGMPASQQSLWDSYPDPTFQWWGEGDEFVIDQHPRGYARLIDELVKDDVPPEDDRLIFDALVTKIEYGTDGVRVSTKDGRTFQGSQVISTLPVGVMQRRHKELFSPPLSKKHDAALTAGGLVMGNLSHVLLQFPNVWWDNSLSRWLSVNKGGQAASGEFTEWYNLNHETLLPGSQMMLSFIGDPQSSLYEGMPDAEAQAAVMSRLRLQHPDVAVPDPVAFFLSRHGYDELSFGAYSCGTVGWTDKDGKILLKPLKDKDHKARVRFAGEAMCSNLAGYTHGGYQSGLEAAADYLYEVGKGPEPSSDDRLNLCWW